MANNPKKIVDPTEAALSAIQEALKVAGRRGPAGASGRTACREPLGSSEETGRRGMQRRLPDVRWNRRTQHRRSQSGQRTRLRVANDDQQSIGQILQSLQRRPARTSYFVAAMFSGRLGDRLPRPLLGLSGGPQRGARPQPLRRRRS